MKIVPNSQPTKLGNWDRKEIARAQRLTQKALYPGKALKNPSMQHKIKDDSTVIMWWRDKANVLVRNVFRGQTARLEYGRHSRDRDFGFEVCENWTLEQIQNRMDELRRRG